MCISAYNELNLHISKTNAQVINAHFVNAKQKWVSEQHNVALQI